jgi:hypothetical protein
MMILCLLLGGCATAPPTTQTVEVPVRVPCLGAVPTRPAFDVEKLGPASTDGEKVLALAADWPRGRKYEGQLEAAITGCR